MIICILRELLFKSGYRKGTNCSNYWLTIWSLTANLLILLMGHGKIELPTNGLKSFSSEFPNLLKLL